MSPPGPRSSGRGRPDHAVLQAVPVKCVDLDLLPASDVHARGPLQLLNGGQISQIKGWIVLVWWLPARARAHKAQPTSAARQGNTGECQIGLTQSLPAATAWDSEHIAEAVNNWNGAAGKEACAHMLSTSSAGSSSSSWMGNLQRGPVKICGGKHHHVSLPTRNSHTTDRWPPSLLHARREHALALCCLRLQLSEHQTGRSAIPYAPWP